MNSSKSFVYKIILMFLFFNKEISNNKFVLFIFGIYNPGKYPLF